MSMTESEARGFLDKLHQKILHDRFAEICTENDILALVESKDAWMELLQYRAIGTVEEIKSFFNENRKAGYKHGHSDGYAKAIDDFSKAVSKRAYHKDYNAWLKDTMISIFEGTIDEIASELKGE